MLTYQLAGAYWDLLKLLYAFQKKLLYVYLILFRLPGRQFSYHLLKFQKAFKVVQWYF